MPGPSGGSRPAPGRSAPLLIGVTIRHTRKFKVRVGATPPAVYRGPTAIAWQCIFPVLLPYPSSLDFPTPPKWCRCVTSQFRHHSANILAYRRRSTTMLSCGGVVPWHTHDTQGISYPGYIIPRAPLCPRHTYVSSHDAPTTWCALDSVIRAGLPDHGAHMSSPLTMLPRPGVPLTL